MRSMFRAFAFVIVSFAQGLCVFSFAVIVVGVARREMLGSGVRGLLFAATMLAHVCVHHTA